MPELSLYGQMQTVKLCVTLSLPASSSSPCSCLRCAWHRSIMGACGGSAAVRETVPPFAFTAKNTVCWTRWPPVGMGKLAPNARHSHRVYGLVIGCYAVIIFCHLYKWGLVIGVHVKSPHAKTAHFLQPPDFYLQFWSLIYNNMSFFFFLPAKSNMSNT